MTETKIAGKSIETIRQELKQWIESHLRELHHAGHGSTLWHGVMQKCCAQAEMLITTTARRLLDSVGDAGIAAVKEIGNGKSLGRFTLGQYMTLLRGLEKPLNGLLDGEAQLKEICSSPLFGKATVSQMDKVSRLRSDFAHNRWPVDSGNNWTADFLKEVGALADAPFVKLAVELERRAT